MSKDPAGEQVVEAVHCNVGEGAAARVDIRVDDEIQWLPRERIWDHAEALEAIVSLVTAQMEEELGE